MSFADELARCKTEDDYYFLLRRYVSPPGADVDKYQAIVLEMEKRLRIIPQWKSPNPDKSGKFPPAPEGEQWYLEWLRGMFKKHGDTKEQPTKH